MALPARLTRLLLYALLLALPSVAAACGDRGSLYGAGEAAEPLLVLAAADLQAALPEIANIYERETGQRVDLVLGSTGNLTTQIEQGAPGDLFFAANQSFIDRLAAGGLIHEETRSVYALGRLALAWSRHAPQPAALSDLRAPAYRRIAIANPEHAPYGVAAREALQAVALWGELRPRLVYGENVAQAMQHVHTANAEAGIVAVGVVLGVAGSEFLLIEANLHAPLRQTAAVLQRSRRPEQAAAFLELALSERGQAILQRYGFDPPDR